MTKRRPLLFGVLILGILLAVAALYYFQNADYLAGFVPRPIDSVSRAHVYKAPDRFIDSIRLRVFYAVPSDRVTSLKPNWSEAISRVVADVSRFHAIQFRGFSKIHSSLFLEPVILEREGLFYDSEKTDAGNPHALIAVAEEIERRVFTPGGDLYTQEFAGSNEGEYVVMGIMYEGVGASGGLIYDSPLETSEEVALHLGIPVELVHVVGIKSADGFFLVNSNCLINSPCKEPGSSLTYHEFAHAVGVQDQYEGDHSFSEDVMGLGRFKPLDSTYLDRSILKEMGVL